MLNIKLPNPTNGGANGSYYKLNSKQGVKVLDDMGFVSPQEAFASPMWKSAEKEGRWMKKAHKAGVGPEFFGVYAVEREGLFYVSILMQHLGNRTLESLCLDDSENYKIANQLWKKLSAAGIDHGDLHEENIMYYRKKYYAIDFGIAYKSIKE